MAKPNYQFEKRQKELAKKTKQEEKRRQKLAIIIVTDDLSQKESGNPSGAALSETVGDVP